MTGAPIPDEQLKAVFRRFFHEARSAISVINGYISVMQEGDAGALNAEQREFLDIVKKSSDRMSETTDKVSDFVLVWSGMMPMKRGPIDFRAILQRAFQDFKSELELHNITVDFNMPDGELKAVGDPALLSKALRYILQDLVKICKEGTACSAAVALVNHMYQLTITDPSGCLTEKKIPIFDEETSPAQSSFSEEDQEMGLGLFLAKHIMELHEGRVWVEPDTPSTSCLRATLPAPKEAEKKKVLIVEDNEFISRLWAEKLKKSEFAVVLAPNGTVGLEKAKTEHPSLVILDVMMPGGLDGFEVCSKLKQQEEFKTVPILLLSNLWQGDLLERAKAVGAVDFIGKSTLSPSALVEKIRELLNCEPAPPLAAPLAAEPAQPA